MCARAWWINRIVHRVYGLQVVDGCVLGTLEKIHWLPTVKFPGGGVKAGEGLRDALSREWQEEVGTPISKIEYLYTTDFFIPSAFGADVQVISSYFLVEAPAPSAHLQVRPIEELSLKEAVRGRLIFVWIALRPDSVEYFTFPSDRRAFIELLAWVRAKSGSQDTFAK